MTLLVRYEYNNATQTTDLALDDNGFIALDTGLETLVFLSLFSDKRARPTDRENDRRGYWGDAHTGGDQYGSWLWLLVRSPISEATRRRAKLYAEDSLRWLVEDGIAKRVTVETTIHQGRAILIKTVILRPDDTPWSALWEHHGRLVNSGVG